jgi:hypothetical protein
MIEQTNYQITKISFKEFLFNNDHYRIILWIAAIAIIIQFSVFKYLYPFASYIHDDSFSYIKAADQNLNINTYLIGYSKFLRLFSVFTKSDTALVGFQYLFLQISALFFLFTLFFFHKTGKTAQIVLLCFVIFNPLLLYMANLISSDALFLALSFIWFALLIWTIYCPSRRIILWHALVLSFAFAVRYNALTYPLISILAFGLSKLPVRKKILNTSFALSLCGLFIIFTMYQYKKLTGYWQYSPFSGWQLANNALYVYRNVEPIQRKISPPKYEKLENIVKSYFDSIKNVPIDPFENTRPTTVYMWTPELPLQKYMEQESKKANIDDKLKKWASMGSLYSNYGIHIIKQYPVHFFKYFVWPNTEKFYFPPLEFLEQYNSGVDSVKMVAQNWFRYKTSKVTSRVKSQSSILEFYPILSGTMNVIFLSSIICFLILTGLKQNTSFRYYILLASITWFLNFSFTIFSSSAALRFQAFPSMLVLTFAVLLLDWMAQFMNSLKKHENTKKEFINQLSKNALT